MGGKSDIILLVAKDLYKRKRETFFGSLLPLAFLERTIEKIRKNEKENSYTKEMSDEKVQELITDHIEYSKILAKQCNENNIKFYDTSFDREDVLKNIIKDLQIEELK